MNGPGRIRDFESDVAEYQSEFFEGSRAWLDADVERFIRDSDRRHLVIIGEPGSGKSTYIAHLAAMYGCPRYFTRTRRGPESPTDGDARDFLVRVGRQLGSRYGQDIFGAPVTIQGTAAVGRARDAATVTGVAIGELVVSEFQRYLIDGTVSTHEVTDQADLAGVRIRRLLYQKASAMTVADLMREAVLDPLATIARQMPDERVILLVDGLDVVPAGPGVEGVKDAIPTADNLRVVMTSRPGQHLARFRMEDKVAISDVGDSEIDSSRQYSDKNQADLHAYIDHEVRTDPLISSALQGRMPLSDYIDAVTERSSGNFLFVHHFLDALREDLRNGKTDFLALESVPRGLHDFYRVSLLERIKGGVPDDRWEDVFVPVLGVLAVAQEALTEGLISAFSGVDRTKVSSVRNRLRGFLDETRQGDRYVYRLYHVSLAEYLIDPALNADYLLDGPSLHGRIAGFYRGTHGTWEEIDWRAASPDDYALRHLTTHLRASGDIAALMALVQNRSWYEVQMASDPTGSAYEVDVSIAWSAAVDDDQVRVAHGEPATGLAGEVRLALALATLRDGWSGTTRELSLLVRTGTLTGRQAVILASKLRVPRGRGLALAQLAPLLPDPDVADAVKVARLIDDPKAQVDSLIALSLRLPASEGQALLDEALEASKDVWIPRERVAVLCRIGMALGAPANRDVLLQAADVAHTIESAQERARALVAISSALPESPDLVDTALKAGLEISEPTDSVWQLTATLPLLDSERRQQTIEHARAVAYRIERPSDRALALASVASYVDAGDRQSIVDDARASARTISNPVRRAGTLLAISDQLDGAERTALLDGCEEPISEIASHRERARLLLARGARLPRDRATAALHQALAQAEGSLSTRERIDLLLGIASEMADDVRDPEPDDLLLDHPWVRSPRAREIVLGARASLLDEARRIASGIAEPLAKARAYLAIGPSLSESEVDSSFRRALEVPGGALVAGHMARDTVERVQLLATLAPSLAADVRLDVVRQALVVARQADRPYDRACGLAALVGLVDGEERSRLLEEILALARESLRPAERADILTRYLSVGPGSDRGSVIEEAAAAAQAIVPGDTSVTAASVDLDTMVAVIDRAPQIRGRPSSALLGLAEHAQGAQRETLIGRAFESVYELPEGLQGTAVEELAPYLSAEQAQFVLADYRAIVSDPLRSAFLQRVSEVVDEMEAANQDSHPSGTLVELPDDDEETNSPIEVPPPSRFVDQGSIPWGDGHLDFVITFSAVGDIFRLTRSSDEQAFDIAFDPPDAFRSEEERISAEAMVVRALVDEFLTDANLMTDIDDLYGAASDAIDLLSGRSWLAALGKLLARLAEDASVEVALKVTREMWDPVPAQAVSALAPHISVADLTNLVNDALELVRDDAPEDRLAAWVELLPLLRGRQRDDAFAVIATDLGSLADQDDAIPILVRLSREADDFPPDLILPIVQRLLRDETGRSDLVRHLHDLLPVLTALGGPGIEPAIAEAVLELSG